jgi:hypothetical protein
MSKRVSDVELSNLGWEFSVDDGRWYWKGMVTARQINNLKEAVVAVKDKADEGEADE